MRELVRRTDADKDCALAICGDLTSLGSIDGYRECVEYLVGTLQLTSDSWQLSSVHAVPGNHDVDRVSVPTHEHDPAEKFDALEQVWSDRSVPVFAKHLRRTEMSDSGSGIDLYGLNSCVGCGEWRQLPDDLRDDLATIFRREAQEAQTEADKGRWERLDTPAFFEQDADDLVAHMRATAPTRLPVIIAHHNLLPQAVPRISPYSELLNGGMLRERLGRLNRPLVYLHGHIHVSPVEVLTQPEFTRSRVVIVAAPQFVDGFNRLVFEFATDGQPIGLEVTPIRVQDNGGYEDRPSLRISLAPPKERPHSDLIQEVLDTVRANPGRMRYTQLRDVVKVAGKRPSEARLQDALREAEWLGWLRLVDRQNAARFWVVEWLGA
jgi:3',5'-cyclic AMP phosphodiesterase CpdA